MVLLLGVGTAAAPLSLGSRHKDESNGFQIQFPRKWEQVPTKFQEVALVGKWAGKAKRGRFLPELNVLRVLRASEEEAEESPRDAAKRGIPGYRSMMRFQPKDVWDYIKNNVRFPMEVVEDDPAFKMSRKKFKAHLRVFRQKGASDERRALAVQLTIVAAEIDTVEPSDSCYGVIYYCADSDAKDMVRTFRNSIRRFRILDPDEEDEEEEEGEGVTDADIFVNSEEKPELWREARKKKLKGVKGWAALDTQNYLIVYNKEVKRPLLKKIAQHIEKIRANIYEKLFPPSREVKAVSVVRVCKDRAEYHRYGGPGGSAGYWSRGDEELVFYQDRSNKKDSLRVLYHEAFHQYIHYAVGDVAPHSWFNEGHGDYFAGHDYVGRRFIAKPFRWRTGIIANALARKTYVPLDKFLKYTQGEYYATPGLCYAQGWSLVYFLREVEKKKVKKYKQYWGLLDRYFEAIKRNVKSVKEGGIEGLNDPPPEKKDGEGEKKEPEEEPAAEEGEAEPEASDPGLPRLPGLEQPFPGEHPDAGAGDRPGEDKKPKEADGARRTVAGRAITGNKSALDAAVDEIFLDNRNIDIKQLEKDWVEWSK
ncbi:MAG: hypothetical protein ACYTEZ_08335 [Planctomycetota bacterium]|jgi:hypothetical protein